MSSGAWKLCWWGSLASLGWGVVVATEYSRIVNGGHIDLMSSVSSTALFWIIGLVQGAIASGLAIILAVRRRSLRLVVALLVASAPFVELAWISSCLGLYAPLSLFTAASLLSVLIAPRPGRSSTSHDSVR